MNEAKGVLSAIGIPIAEELQRHAARPPYDKAVARSSFGAFLLGLCGYAVKLFGASALSFAPPVLLGVAAVAAFGLLLLIVGLHGARGGPRDIMGAFWALAVPVGGWFGLSAWFGPEVFNILFVQWIGIAVLCSCAVRFLIAARLSGDSSALRKMKKYLKAKSKPMRPARPRQF